MKRLFICFKKLKFNELFIHIFNIKGEHYIKSFQNKLQKDGYLKVPIDSKRDAIILLKF